MLDQELAGKGITVFFFFCLFVFLNTLHSEDEKPSEWAETSLAYSSHFVFCTTAPPSTFISELFFYVNGIF